MTKERLDLSAIRASLSRAKGRDFWRSLDELAGTAEFRELLEREFPRQASVWPEGVGRRDFLRLMAASLALAGLGACGAPGRTDEKIVPYVQQPEQIVPGKPLFFATAFTLSGFATGVLVESHEGRPTKIEGNPEHPASLGATDAFAQASILSLYDPDRSQVLSRAGRISTPAAFLAAIQPELERQRLTRGSALRFLTGTITSPTLARQLREFLDPYPNAKWVQYEPIHRDHALEGARLAFGEVVEAQARFEVAEVILALDADFLFAGPAHLRYAREFVAQRRVHEKESAMNRLYVIEPTPSITGAMADHRWAVPASRMEMLVRALAAGVGVPVGTAAQGGSLLRDYAWLGALVRDLRSHRGRSLVLAGDSQSPMVHALAHAMNQALGNTGRTVAFVEPIEANPVNQTDSLRSLVDEMGAGAVEVLIILGGNPVFNAPADLQFAERLSKVRFRVHLGLYEDETSAHCHWHIPEAHYLESWSDARAFDGAASILQPLIAPLYGGRSAHEFLSALAAPPGQSGYDLVRNFWRARYRGQDFERFWRTALHDGVVPGTASKPKPVQLRRDWSFASRAPAGTAPESETKNPKPETRNSLEIIFRPDPTIFDGRFANNGWLQELPKPLTKLTWDNAALVSPETAARLGLSNEDLVELRLEGRTVRAPVWILPGQAEKTVTVHLGYGRARAGQVGTGAGFNAYALRSSNALWHASGLELRKLNERHPLACTQLHHNLRGRRLVRVGTLEDYRKHPEFAQGAGHPSDGSLYPEVAYQGYAWGMAIDINACIGCNACVIACQAENNVPIVGKQEILRGREMHWLRIDRYHSGALDEPETYFQPLLCMHCEKAPCEVVCPVAATVHSSEGLNDMIYNRCVGTRYCSNNCPYKVRRFNFLQYSNFDAETPKLMRNPDVTVRSRGVMEKCTYCVQRINAARIQAKKEDREVRDGEIETACQAACPTEAIVFGNINDPNGRVATLKRSPLNYGLLTELNTQPRTTYLARLRNPNPEIDTG